jgi:endonuclease/exonuclease/phosphatase family metal-dependent hydrolase
MALKTQLLLIVIILGLGVSSASASTPFAGSPVSIPATGTVTIQAENFDNGAKGDAYYDTTAGNEGDYRTRNTDVDIQRCSEGVCIGWFTSNEWLVYTVSVAKAGYYTFEGRVANGLNSQVKALRFQGAGADFSVTVPYTGSWEAWTTVKKTGVYLTAGTTRLKIATSPGSFNFSYFKLTAQASATSGATPYTTINLPGRIRADYFDNGGQNVAYDDNSAGNLGDYTARATDVDLQVSTDGAPNVGWMDTGEWLQYTVNVSQTGSYNIIARVASPLTEGEYSVYVDGTRVITNQSVPKTGGWQNWANVTRGPIPLTAGQRRIKFAVVAGGFNLKYLDVAAATAPAPTTSPTPTTSTRLRVITWNIYQGYNVSGVYALPQQIALVAAEQPDVILVQEDDDSEAVWVSELTRRTGKTWRVFENVDGNLILSHLPFLETEARLIGPSSWWPGYRQALRVMVSVNGVRLNIFDTHLDWHSNVTQSDRNLRENMDKLRAFMRESAGTPRIVGGDLNAWIYGTPGQIEVTNEIRTEYIDSCLALGYTDSSCPRTHSAGWRPDYIYRSIELNTRVRPTAIRTISTTLSDHKPVVVDFSVQ